MITLLSAGETLPNQPGATLDDNHNSLGDGVVCDCGELVARYYSHFIITGLV